MCSIFRNNTKQHQVTTAGYNYSHMLFRVLSACHLFQTCVASDLGANFKQLYLHAHCKLDTRLYELIYSELSILPPPKIFTIPPTTPCICMYVYTHTYIHVYTAVNTYFNVLFCSYFDTKFCLFSLYSITPLIQINWEDKPSGYAENPDNVIFLCK